MDILITGAIVLGGYFLKKNSEQSNFTNIYQSHLVDDATNKTQEIADERYADAQNPNFSGIVNPVVYHMGQIGDPSVLSGETTDFDGTFSKSANPIKTLQASFDQNKYMDPRMTQQPLIPLPQPSSSGNLTPAIVEEFYTFAGKDPLRSDITGEIITLPDNNMPFTKKSYEPFKDLVPAVKFDSMVGNVSTFFNKKEVESFTDGVAVPNVHNTMVAPDSADTRSRMQPSRYKNNEVLADPILLAKPIAWSAQAPNQLDTYKNLTLENLRVNPKETYNGRTLQGQRESENQIGIQGPVNTNKPSTVTDKQFLMSGPAAYVALPADQNFSNIQDTNRQSYTETKYTGSAQSILPKQMNGIENFTETQKNSEIVADFLRNVTNNDRVTGDYNKDAMSAYGTQRETTDTIPLLNVQRESKNPYVSYTDKAKVTSRQTLDNIKTTNEKGLYEKGAIDAMSSGASIINAKTTTKQMGLFSYKGNVQGPDAMGYLGADVDARTTMKQMSLHSYDANAKGPNAMSYIASEYGAKSTLRDIMEQRESKANGSAPQILTNNPGFAVIKENKLLAENTTTHTNLNMPGMPSMNSDSIGKDTRDTRDDMKFIDRNDPSLLYNQLKDNPFVVR